MGTLKKNFLYNTAYQVLQVLLPLITAPYIARTLGATSLGVYSYTNSVAYYFLLVAMLGIANHGNRSVAEVREDRKTLDKTFSGIFMLQGMTFSVALAGYCGYLFFFVRENHLISALQAIYLLSGMLDISWLYFGLEKFKTTVSRNVIIKLVTVLAIFMFVHTPDDLWKYTLIMVLGSLLSQLYLWLKLKQYVCFTVVSFREALSHLKPALILFVPVLAYSIYKVMDKIMLGNMADFAQVGFYSNAEKIINIPMGIITALGTVMLPRLSSQIARGENAQVKQYICLSTKLVTIFSSAVGFGLMGVSTVFSQVFFGSGYEACGPLILTMSVSVFFIAWANVVRMRYLIPYHNEKVYLISTIAGAAANLTLNLCLIPGFQALGAAVGSVAAEMTVLVIQVVTIRKELPMCRYILSNLPVLTVGAIMAIVVGVLGKVLPVQLSTLILQICSGGVFFCAALIVWMKYNRDTLWLSLRKQHQGEQKV